MSKYISPIVLDSSLTNGANEPLYLDSMGKLPAIDGSNLTNLPGGVGGSTNLSLANITSTTIDVLSSSGTDVTLPAASTTQAGLMSAADKVSVLANSTTPYLIPSEISSKFQAYWDLKEDGDITDSIGGVRLTSVGTNVTNTLKVGSRVLPAKRFVGAEHLLGSTSGVVQPTGSFSFVVGVSISTLPTTGEYWGIVSKDDGGSQRSYTIVLSGDTGKFQFLVTTNGTTLIIAECLLTPTANTNYFIHAKFDATNSLIGISVNGSTPVTISASSVFNSTNPFVIGSFVSRASSVSLRGSVAFVGLSSLLTEVEAEAIRNGGSWKTLSSDIFSTPLSLRDSATLVTQTINSNGSISQVVYTLPTGTITDSYTYGPNSLVEPTSVTRGNLILGGSTGLTQVPLTWTTANGGSLVGNVLTIASTGGGALAFTTINSANAFEVVALFSGASSDAMVVFLDDDATQNYQWGGGQNMVSGQYTNGGNLYSTTNGAVSGLVGAITYPVYVKAKKSGADLLIQTSSNAITYNTVLTRAGILIGQPLYLKALLAAGSNISVDIKLYI